MVFHAPLDIVLSEYDVVHPDLVFFTAERRHLIKMMQATRVPPDLAVEVLSRSTEARTRSRSTRSMAGTSPWLASTRRDRLLILKRYPVSRSPPPAFSLSNLRGASGLASLI